MAKTRKSGKAPADAQNTRDGLELGMDIPAAQDAAERAASGQIIGPADESELLGCQSETELQEDALCLFVVAGCDALNLREAPSLDASVAAVLPRDSGVFGDGEPGPDGWRHVRTGRLEGWMLARYLEPFSPPELGHGAD